MSQTYYFEPVLIDGKRFVITLTDTGKRSSDYNKAIVSYAFGREGEPPIFTGSDLQPSPMHKPESYNSALDLLGFLTLQEGDTDSEYFDKYTPAQLEFCRSYECECLSGLGQDEEERIKNE